MDAAEAAGGEHPDAGPVGEEGGRGDGGAAVLAERRHHREVAQARLVEALGRRQLLDLRRGQADRRHARVDADGGRDDAGGAQPLLRLQRYLQVARPGQPVGEDRRLQGDDGGAGGDGLGDFLGDADGQSGHGVCSL